MDKIITTKEKEEMKQKIIFVDRGICEIIESNEEIKPIFEKFRAGNIGFEDAIEVTLCVMTIHDEMAKTELAKEFVNLVSEIINRIEYDNHGHISNLEKDDPEFEEMILSVLNCSKTFEVIEQVSI